MKNALSTPVVALAALLVLTLFADDAHAKRKRLRCKKSERLVAAGMPAFRGPGLGFETAHVFKKRRCLQVFRTTPDGAFALVPIDAAHVGWVATGQVEASLSEAKDAKPVPLEAPVERYVVRGTPLFDAPRFDAKAKTSIPGGTKLSTEKGSPDGLWLWVTHDGKSGWLSRYQTVAALPEAGSAVTAGEGKWIVRAEELPVKPPPAASVEKAKAKGEEETSPSEGATPDGETGAKTPTDVVAATRLLGRGHEVSFRTTIGQWSQRYLSDAYDDAFGRYDLGSTGPSFGFGYGFRGDIPFTFDARSSLGLYGFEIVVPNAAGVVLNNTPVYTSVLTFDFGLHAGWRLYGDEFVDVEAGLGSQIKVVWISDLLDGGGDRVDAFTPGAYLDILRPHVMGRTRLGGGAYGMASVEAAIPLGLYAMVYDPGGKWWDDRAQYPVVDQLRPPRADEDPPVDPNDVEPPTFHPSLGVEGRFNYAFPLGDSFQLDLGVNLGVHQAFIGGPGVRAFAVYTQATNIDLMGGIDLGGTFAF